LASDSPLHTPEQIAQHEAREAWRAKLRPICMAIGGVGGVLSVLAAMQALEVSEWGGVFNLIDGRTGTGVGITALVMALISLGGALVIPRSAALASAMMYVGGCGGFLAIGGTWLIPGLLTLVAANLALWAIPDPLWSEPAPRQRRKRPAAA
jgi:hypothetical protein